MSYFTEEALKKFQEMCAAGIDFGEGDPYDFAMCLMPNGDVYGVEPGEACEKGRPISDAQGRAIKTKKKAQKTKKKDDRPDVRMAKLKRAFAKKMGREMNKEELAKASWMINKGK